MDGHFHRTWWVILVVLGLVTGCVGIPTQLAWVIFGQKIPAEFDGLDGKRVAVVCVSDASAYGPTTLTYRVERMIADRLKANCRKIELISQSEINEWKDQNAWNEENYYQLGRGVGAEMVLAIEISNYSLYDGQTMYKGHSIASSTVYDVAKGNVAFHKQPEEYTFPKGGRPSIQNNDRVFEEAYLTKLCEYLARRFYDIEKKETFAEDAGS